MPGLVESATAIMTMAERRLDVVSRNVANISTPGYKRKMAFVDAIGATPNVISAVPKIAVHTFVDQGKLQSTGNPLDMAISGPGYFVLRSGETLLYSRQGQFRRDPAGAIVTPQGYVLQQAGGGDLVAEGALSLAADGTLLVDGQPVARIAIQRPENDGTLTPVGESYFSAGSVAMEDVENVTLRSAMVESSNVSLGDEMTQSMLALRQAENGARLIQLYDDLMGRAVTAFGQGGGR